MITLLLAISLGLPQEPEDDELSNVVEALIASTDDESEVVRSAALRALVTIDSDNRLILKAIVARFRDSEQNVRNEALLAFRSIEGKEVEKTEFLLSLIREEDADIRGMAFGELRSLRESALDQLVLVLNSNMLSDATREGIFYLLQLWGSDSAPAIEAICEVYRARESFRPIALETLASIGAPAKVAIPLIVEATTDSQMEIRRQAVVALSNIAGDPERILNASQDVDEKYRQYANSLISRYDTNGDRVIEGDELAGVRSIDAMDLNGDRRLTANEIERSLMDRMRERDSGR